MRAANCMRDYGTTNNTPAHQAPPVWRAPEGLEDLTAAQVGGGGACQHTNDKPDRSGAPRGLRGLAGHHTDTPTDWRPPRGLRGLAAVPVGGGRAWPGFEIDHSERSSRVAISRAGRRPPAHTAARPNKTSHAAAGPGRALSRRAEHHQPRMPNWCGGHRRARPRCRRAAAGPGRASRRHAEPIISTPCSTCVEDTGGPGRGAGGRRQGLAGLRDDTPSAARGPDGERAGRRPPAPTRRHKHSATNA